MQQSRPAVEAGASGEKTDEREGDAADSWRNGNIQFTNRRGENSSANEDQLFSNNMNQGHLALSISDSSSHRQTTDSGGRGESSSCESHTREMQSVTARAVYQMVPLAASTIATALARSFGQGPGYD